MGIYLGSIALGGGGGAVINSYAALNIDHTSTSPVYEDSDGGVWLRTGSTLQAGGSDPALDLNTYTDAYKRLTNIGPPDINFNIAGNSGETLATIRNLNSSFTTSGFDAGAFETGSAVSFIHEGGTIYNNKLYGGAFNINGTTVTRIANDSVDLKDSVDTVDGSWAFLNSYDGNLYAIYSSGSNGRFWYAGGQTFGATGNTKIVRISNLTKTSATEITITRDSTFTEINLPDPGSGRFWAGGCRIPGGFVLNDARNGSGRNLYRFVDGTATPSLPTTISGGTYYVAVDYDGTYLTEFNGGATNGASPIKIFRRRADNNDLALVDSSGTVTSVASEYTMHSSSDNIWYGGFDGNSSGSNSNFYSLLSPSANGNITGFTGMSTSGYLRFVVDSVGDTTERYANTVSSTGVAQTSGLVQLYLKIK
jgi:hypothetical protein